MRASTATIILAFCSMLATYAAPAPVGGGLAMREASMGDSLTARAIQVEEREEGGLEEREAKWVMVHLFIGVKLTFFQKGKRKERKRKG